MEKRYSIFISKLYSKKYCKENNICYGAIEEDKLLKRYNSKFLANFYFKDRISTLLDFYKKSNEIEIVLYDHKNHTAVARCSYINTIRGDEE